MFRILLNLSFVYSVLAQSRFDVANSERSTVECQCGQVTVALPIRAYNRYTVIPESPTSASSPTLPTSPPSLHPKVDRFITNVSSILRELKTSKSACMTPKMATSDVMNVALMRVRTTLDEAYDDMRTSIAMMVSTASDTIFPRDTLDREFLRNEIQVLVFFYYLEFYLMNSLLLVSQRAPHCRTKEFQRCYKR